MFVRNGQVLGSVLNSAVPGAKSRKQETPEPVVEPEPVAEATVEPEPQSEPEPTAAPEPKKAPPKKAAFKSALDTPKG